MAETISLFCVCAFARPNSDVDNIVQLDEKKPWRLLAIR